MADHLVDSFGALPGPITYEMYFGLRMNSQRMFDRGVYRAGLAATLASGRGEVPLSIVSAACDSAEQAEDLHWTINADRAQAEQGF